MTSLNCYLENETFLKQNDIEKIAKAFSPLELGIGSCLIKRGNTTNQVAFIESGIMKATINEDMTGEKVQYFVAPGHFVSEPYVLYRNEPAKYQIEAATDVHLMLTTSELLQKYGSTIAGLALLIKTISEKELSNIIEQKNVLNQNNATDKYMAFAKRNPEIVAQVKDCDIASFLGITKYTLCRIKKKALKGTSAKK